MYDDLEPVQPHLKNEEVKRDKQYGLDTDTVRGSRFRGSQNLCSGRPAWLSTMLCVPGRHSVLAGSAPAAMT